MTEVAATPLLEEEGDIAVETLLVSDSSSKQLRHILHRNSRERAVGQLQAKSLEHQRKTKEYQLAREEKEIRQRLQRLHLEQKVLNKLDSLQDEAIVQTVSLCNSAAVSIDDISIYEQQEDLVVNPYPVALRPSGIASGSSSGGSNTPQEGAVNSLYRGRRRVSVEFEDLDIQTSTGKVIGPVRSRSMRHLSHFHSDSMISIGSVQQREKCEEDNWAGSPEAIHSIRRPRKSVAQQRLEKLVARSNSYSKERENNERSASTASSSNSIYGILNRSQSLKERPKSHRVSSANQESCRRANSWKERGRKCVNKSSEGVNEELQFLDLNQKGSKSPATPRGRRGGSRNAILSRQSSNLSLRDFISTPETKSSVWGSAVFQDDATDGGTHHRQRGKGRLFSGCQSDAIQLPPLATDGSTSATCPLKSPRSCNRSTSPLSARRGPNSREGSFKRKT